MFILYLFSEAEGKSLYSVYTFQNQHDVNQYDKERSGDENFTLGNFNYFSDWSAGRHRRVQNDFLIIVSTETPFREQERGYDTTLSVMRREWQ